MVSLFSDYILNKQNSRQVYNIMAAIRGPDNMSGYGRCGEHSNERYEANDALAGIKKHVTGRLRHIAFGDRGRHAPYVIPVWTTTTLTDSDIETVRNAATNIRQADSYGWAHYREHLDDAIFACRDHPIWGDKANELCAALCGE